MWWNPDLDPLPAYGNTSAVFGYCGNSIAPLAGAQRDEIVDLLCFLEDLPLDAFQREVPWSWERWPEYAQALAGRSPTAVHVGGYLGHLSLRTFVMGAAAWERAATADEIARMCAAARRGPAPRRARPVGEPLRQGPSRCGSCPASSPTTPSTPRCSRSLARHPGRTFQVITRFNDPDHYLARRRALRPAVPRRRRARASGRASPPTCSSDTGASPTWDLHRQRQRRRRRLLAQRRRSSRSSRSSASSGRSCSSASPRGTR